MFKLHPQAPATATFWHYLRTQNSKSVIGSMVDSQELGPKGKAYLWKWIRGCLGRNLGLQVSEVGGVWAPSGCSPSVLHYGCPIRRNAVGGGTQQAPQKLSKGQPACSAPLKATRIVSGKMPEKKHLRK